MKIEKLRLKNFAQFEDFEIVFNHGVTHLVGINGAGKTTVGLTALWAGFKGIAEKSSSGQLLGQRWRFITEGKKSLDVEITLHDDRNEDTIILKRHITKTTNSIKIVSNSNNQLSREYIENLFNVSFLSASHFSTLTGQQQAEAMGINVSSYDDRINTVKERAREIRAEIKAVGVLEPIREVSKVDIVSVQKERAAAVQFNLKQSDLIESQNKYKTLIAEDEEKVKNLLADIEKNKKLLSVAMAEVKDLVPLQPFDIKVSRAVEINTRAEKYIKYISDKNKLDKLESELKANKECQDQILDERIKYLQSKTFGIKGLEVDSFGQLIKDGKLIRSPYFSKGELEVLVARIAMGLNPELKVRFIDDFDLLDDHNQELLIKNLTKRDFQIITASVGDTKKSDNSVLLRACKLEGQQPALDGLDSDYENKEADNQEEGFLTMFNQGSDCNEDDTFY